MALQTSEKKRDSSCLPAKKGKVCVASEFPEKFSQRMAELCGWAPSWSLEGAPSAGHHAEKRSLARLGPAAGHGHQCRHLGEATGKNLLSLGKL